MTTHSTPKHAASLAERLVERCAGPIGERELAKAVRHISDWCGIAIAATEDPAATLVRSAVVAASGAGPCSTFGASSLPVEAAAFANGSLGTILEMDDLHRASIMHAGDVVIPAALAAAQYSNASGRQLVEAVIIGYEVAILLGTAAARGGYAPWYNSAVCGVFGAAIASTHAAGGGDQAKLDALGQAGMQAGGIWQCRLEDTDSKAVATAHAARAGVTSALLALNSVRGARSILDGPLGFFASYYPKALDRFELTDAPDAWALNDISFKPWPACRHVHPAVDLALQLRGRLDVARIRNVSIQTYKAAIDFCDTPHPTTDHEARFSLQHCAAVALLTGDLRLQDARESHRNDPAVTALRDKIKVSYTDDMTARFPEKMGARVEILHESGTQHSLTTHNALGDPERPMSDEALERKFCRNLRSVGVQEEDATALLGAVRGLPDAPDLKCLTAALQMGGHSRTASNSTGVADG